LDRLQARLRLGFSHIGGGGAQRKSFSIYKLALPANRDAYVKCLEEALHVHLYRSDFCSEYNWQELHCCIVQAAEDAIGHGKQRQPEWFEVNVHL